MIDALFGSKTRVKLLHLFLNNPGKSFYVREITRIIDEQINSVRRELSNMLNVGIITSDSADNKLYYEVNQRYEYYVPMRAIFGDGNVDSTVAVEKTTAWHDKLKGLAGLRLVVLSGVLVKGSTSDVDLLIVTDNAAPAKLRTLLKGIEKLEGRELHYTILGYDEFYYRMSVRDKFITEILTSNHSVLLDIDDVLTSQK